MYMELTGTINIERHSTDYYNLFESIHPGFLLCFEVFTENSTQRNIYGRIVVTFHNATHML